MPLPPMTMKEKRQGHRDRKDTGTILPTNYKIANGFDGIPSGTRVTSYGLVITTGSRKAIPVSSLPKMEYLRKLAAERRRVRKELAALGEKLKQDHRCPVCGSLLFKKGKPKGHPTPARCRELKNIQLAKLGVTGRKVGAQTGKKRNKPKPAPLV